MSIMRQLAAVATVSQLRTALKLEPRPEPEPEPRPEPQRSITKTSDERGHLLADQTSARRGGDVRRGAAVPS